MVNPIYCKSPKFASLVLRPSDINAYLCTCVLWFYSKMCVEKLNLCHFNFVILPTSEMSECFILAKLMWFTVSRLCDGQFGWYVWTKRQRIKLYVSCGESIKNIQWKISLIFHCYILQLNSHTDFPMLFLIMSVSQFLMD